MPKEPGYVTDQGFPNSGKGWGGENPPSPPSGGGMGNFTRGGFFYQVVGIWGGLHLTFQGFFKVKHIIL